MNQQSGNKVQGNEKVVPLAKIGNSRVEVPAHLLFAMRVMLVQCLTISSQ